ncbi:MAG TPA: hypothetical protein PLL10_00880 [Elusimicrobiales bacterium]|nr:hypothetical protein [Elusimicrobiales bacterium]
MLLLPLLCALSAHAQELKPHEEMPLPTHQPVAEQIAQELAEPLSFSSSQTKRVQRALESEVDNKADRLQRQYAILSDELRLKRYKLREIIYDLYMVRGRLPGTARSALTPEKKEVFDPLVYQGRFQYDSPRLSVVPKAEVGDEVVETTTTLPDGRVVKKKIIIRRKKADSPKPEADAAESPAAEIHFESLIYSPQP